MRNNGYFKNSACKDDKSYSSKQYQFNDMFIFKKSFIKLSGI